MRRLPVFFVLDCSESMVGDNLEKMKHGIQKIVTDLRRNPHALETVYISIIAFAGQVKTIVPLIDLISFYPPLLPIGGGTSLGGALSELRRQIDLHVRKTTHEQKGDWQPIVYLLTDGKPTDDVASEITIWKEQYTKKANLIAISLGQSADIEVLHELTDQVLLFNDQNADDFNQFMKWITASVSAHSQSIHNDEQLLNEYSNVISLAKARANRSYDDSCVVLVGRCSNSRKPYLMKYESIDNLIAINSSQAPQYQLSGCYPVDEEYFAWSDGQSAALQVNTHQLIGTPSCPHCGNGSAFAMCDCGHLLCLDRTGEVTCPWCQQYLRFNMEGQGSDFDVTRGKG